MPLTPGTSLGPYDIVAPLGAGGMGEVYRARDNRLDRDVAIKVLPEGFAADPDRRARFEREAKAIAALSHPNILAIFDFGEHDGRFYAATELLQGETLRERLKTGALPSRKIVDLGIQIARGLAAAHDRGLVHRDLKPENLFLVADGQIKILDFGLARQTTSASGSGATQTVAATDPGTVLGTIGYMAPEQVRGLAVDGRADLFSLGAVLYEMATGTRAFERATAADTMSAILREDVPDVTGTRTDVSPALDRIIRHCLEKDPTERFQTARDVAFALGSLSSTSSTSGASLATNTGTDTDAHAAPAATTARARTLRWLVPAVLTIAAAAAGIAAGRAMAPPASNVLYTQKTMVPQVIFHARFMPDGQTIIFSSALSGNVPSLFESRADSAAQRAFGPPGTHLLSISKSGELAVLTGATYIGHRLMTGTLSRMTLEGAPRAIAEKVREADWLPDGSDLAVIREMADGRDQLEFPMGTAVHQAQGYLSDPRVSPDGTRVAFLEHPVKYDNRGFVKVVDRAGVVTTLSQDFNGAEGIAWSRDGQSVLFSGALEADYVVYSAPASGTSPAVPMMSSAGSLYVHDVAPDGRLIVTREDTRYGVVARGAGQQADRDLTPFDQAWLPVLSADGRMALFSDGRGGKDYAVVLRNVDGSPPVRLGDGNGTDLSADGRWAAANLITSGRCVVYPTGAGAMVPVELGPMERCTQARFFPDGKSLLLMGNEKGKPERAFRATFPGGIPEPLLPEGIAPIRISADGRSVIARDLQGIVSRIQLGGESTVLKGFEPGDDVVEWAPDERTAIVSRSRSLPAQIYRVQLDSGARTKIGEVGPADRAGIVGLQLFGYRNNGAQYIYGYFRRISALYLVERDR